MTNDYAHDQLDTKKYAEMNLPEYTRQEAVSLLDMMNAQDYGGQLPVDRVIITDGYICGVIFEQAPYGADRRRICAVIGRVI